MNWFICDVIRHFLSLQKLLHNIQDYSYNATPVADVRGTPGMCAPLGAKILSFSCMQFSAQKIGSHTHLCSWHPPQKIQDPPLNSTCCTNVLWCHFFTSLIRKASDFVLLQERSSIWRRYPPSATAASRNVANNLWCHYRFSSHCTNMEQDY